MKHPLQNKTVRRKYHANYIKQLDRDENQYLKVLKRYFRDQEKRLIESLDKRKELLDETFNEESEIEELERVSYPVLAGIMLASGKRTIDFVGYNYPFRLTGDIDTWLKDRIHLFSNQINETTFNQLARDFKESLESGEAIQDLQRRIRNRYDKISKGRAMTIARTEVHGITNKAIQEGYKQAMVPTKIWVSVLGATTRDSHAAMDGQEAPLDYPFTSGLGNKLMFPGDSSLGAGPEDTINCRCTI